MKRGTVLAHSGYASVVFDWFSTRNFGSTKKTLQTIVTGADSAGHSGIIRGLTDHLWSLRDFRELYSLLQREEIDVPPLGDLRNQISRWSELYGRLFSRRLVDGVFEKAAFNLFSSIISDPQNQIEKARIGETLFNSYYGSQREYDPEELTVVLENRFQKYILLFKEASTARYAENKAFENIKHAVGNIVLHFLYIECVQAFKNTQSEPNVTIEKSSDFVQAEVSLQELYFGLLRNLNLIPRNLWLRILREKGLHLQAVTQDGQKIKGEGVIDNMDSSDKLRADSFELFLDIECVDEVTKDEEVNRLFTNIVETTDYWIVPPGSVSNWMPIINQFGEQIKNSKKPIYMFSNSFVQINEPELIDQLIAVEKKVGRFQLIIPEINPTEVEGYYEYFAEGYANQNKIPVDFNNLETQVKELNLDVLIHKMLNWKTLSPNEGGLKYAEQEISLILSLIGESLDNAEPIEADQKHRILDLNGLIGSAVLYENIDLFLKANNQFLKK